jgi:hypothetical protein
MSKKQNKVIEDLEKTENIEDLEKKENIEVIEDSILLEPESSDDESIDEPKLIRQKKPRTQKQIEAFKMVCEKRNQKRNERKIEKEEKEKVISQLLKHKEEEEQEKLERKIVSKAISIKKKQIKKQAVLDEISDDDTPIEKIKKISQQLPNKSEQIRINQTPSYYFV